MKIRPLYRAWRFTHPNFEAREGLSGFELSTSGAIAMVEARAAVRQSVLMLLSTKPGERLMRPEYGCALHRLAFAPNDETTAGLAIHYVGRALARWEPRVDVLKLDATRDPLEPTRLNIELEYRVRGLSDTQDLTFPFNLLPVEA